MPTVSPTAPAAAKCPEARMLRTAREMEGMFLRMFLKEAVSFGPMTGSESGGFDEILLDALSTTWAERGGIGLAGMLGDEGAKP